MLGSLRSKFARREPAARVEPVIVPRAPARAIALSRAHVARVSAPSAAQVFKAYEPPPGVVPAGAKLAMDDATTGAALRWASAAVEEGVTFLGYPMLAEMAQRAEYRHMVEVRAKEATREWIKFSAKGDEDKSDRIAAIEDFFERHKVRSRARKVAELDGFFGLSHLFIDTGLPYTDPRLMTPQLLTSNSWRKGSFRGLVPIEPIWTTPQDYNSYNPIAEDFYRPSSWFIQGSKVHASRLFTFHSREVPNLLKPTYNFGGLALTQMAKPYVDNWLRTRQSVSDLINAFSIVHFSTNMSALLQEGGEDAIINRVVAFNAYRNNRDTFVSDKDTESLEILNAQLSGLDKLQAQSQEQMASVVSTPLIKLFGLTPAGLGATGDGEIRVWYDFVDSYREMMFRDFVAKMIKIAQLDIFGDIDDGITFDFIPLWQLDEEKRAAIQKTYADIDKQNVEAGIVSPQEARERVAHDEASPYQGIDLSGEAPEPPALPDDADPDANPDLALPPSEEPNA